MASARGLRAVVVGGTGGIGKCILGELVTSSAFSEVLSLGRREATIPECYEVTESDRAKLKHEVVDFDLDKFTVENSKTYFEGKDVLFLAIGIVMAQARRLPGNANENFKRVDLDLVVRCAQIAKAAGVRHVSMMSVRGASSDSWFFFLKTKAQAEDEVEALGFERTTIWKPSIVDKGPSGRFLEKLLKFFFKTTLAEDVGRGIREEAEQWALGKTEFPPISRYEDRELWEFVRQAKESQAKAGDRSDVSAANARDGDARENEEKQAADEEESTVQQGNGDKPSEESDPRGGATESEKDSKQD